MQNFITEQADIIIIGAGPAGTACALQLRTMPHLRVILLDKATFPRQKVCGDAIGGHSIKILLKYCPELIEDFRLFSPKTRTRQTQIFVNKRKPFFIRWVNEAYCCKRLDFDNFLFEGVKKWAKNVEIVENFSVHQIERNTEGGVTISSKNSERVFKAKMIIGADGAHSIVNKLLTDTRMAHQHHSAAVRAYFEGVKDMRNDTTEVYISRAFTPGYLWVFPVSDTVVNVGFGMLSEEISKREINLKKAIFEFIEQTPVLKTKFNSAKQIGKLEGFGLPMGSRRVTMSGEGFLLTGDAASLIDPSSGDGIGNAIVSGIFAGEKAIEACQKTIFQLLFRRI
ncbi:MAG: geranylgeranyl reductase family protein [Saprospiraceae bacterium]|nr:geranylgeranyl reductase family protein [Saprospiraceae bacterium]